MLLCLKMTPNLGKIVAMLDDGAAIQDDFVTVNTRPIWSFIQEQLQSPTLAKEEHLAVIWGTDRLESNSAGETWGLGRQHSDHGSGAAMPLPNHRMLPSYQCQAQH